jgi:hypothetical protein
VIFEPLSHAWFFEPLGHAWFFEPLNHTRLYACGFFCVLYCNLKLTWIFALLSHVWFLAHLHHGWFFALLDDAWFLMTLNHAWFFFAWSVKNLEHLLFFCSTQSPVVLWVGLNYGSPVLPVKMKKFHQNQNLSILSNRFVSGWPRFKCSPPKTERPLPKQTKRSLN